MIDYELKKYLLFDIDNTEKFIKERRQKMRKKKLDVKLAEMGCKIRELETDVKQARNRIDVLELAGTFDMNKVEIKLGYEREGDFFGFIAQYPVIKVKYIKNNRVEVSKLPIDDETLCKLTSITPKIIKNDDKHVLFSFGDYNFVLSRETGLMMEFPAIEKKPKEKKS